MFIDTQPDLITAPEESNVAAVVNMALRWSANPVGGGAINIWPRRGQTPPNQHTIAPLRIKVCRSHLRFTYELQELCQLVRGDCALTKHLRVRKLRSFPHV